jgi:hypothetical protein
MSVPGAIIRALPGDLKRLPAAAATPGAGLAALAAELLDRVRAELPTQVEAEVQAAGGQ